MPTKNNNDNNIFNDDRYSPDDNNQLDNLTDCPENIDSEELEDSSQWELYAEQSSLHPIGEALFKGNQTTYLENVEPSEEKPQQECVYDNEGELIDENHEYAGMGGTANERGDTWGHIFHDPGGIAHSGSEAFMTSMEYYGDSIVEDAEELYEDAKDMYHNIFEKEADEDNNQDDIFELEEDVDEEIIEKLDHTDNNMQEYSNYNAIEEENIDEEILEEVDDYF